MTAPVRGFYESIKPTRTFDQDELTHLFELVSQERVELIADNLAAYLTANLPTAIRSKTTLADYRTNPYVLMTTSSTMKLEDARDFANFLVNLKLYMGLETSFGKSIEGIVVGTFPIAAAQATHSWTEPPEKAAEFDSLSGLSREDRARARNESRWREIDRSCVVGSRRHLVTIKSGPSTINDTQVTGMKDAIRDHHLEWLASSTGAYDVEGIDIVIGLTYGTERTTNNKENQILVKLMESGFMELDRDKSPGVLTNGDGSVRVYRRVGAAFWSYIGSPEDPESAPQTFLEVLLALAKSLSDSAGKQDIEEALNDRLDLLAAAIRELRFARGSLPGWIRDDFNESELTWLAAAMTAYFDATKT